MPLKHGLSVNTHLGGDVAEGALAAGLLGGSRFLGVSADTGRFLNETLSRIEGSLPSDEGLAPRRLLDRWTPTRSRSSHTCFVPTYSMAVNMMTGISRVASSLRRCRIVVGCVLTHRGPL